MGEGSENLRRYKTGEKSSQERSPGQHGQSEKRSTLSKCTSASADRKNPVATHTEGGLSPAVQGAAGASDGAPYQPQYTQGPKDLEAQAGALVHRTKHTLKSCLLLLEKRQERGRTRTEQHS